MIIRLFGGLRLKAGTKEKPATGATIREALESICSDNEELHAAIFADDGLRLHVRVMVNGHDSELAQGLETPVSKDDKIAIFPPIAGG